MQIKDVVFTITRVGAPVRLHLGWRSWEWANGALWPTKKIIYEHQTFSELWKRYPSWAGMARTLKLSYVFLFFMLERLRVPFSQTRCDNVYVPFITGWGNMSRFIWWETTSLIWYEEGWLKIETGGRVSQRVPIYTIRNKEAPESKDKDGKVQPQGRKISRWKRLRKMPFRRTTRSKGKKKNFSLGEPPFWGKDKVFL